MQPLEVELRKARGGDVPQIEKLIKYWADQNVMLHRSRNELYEHIRDYVVIADVVTQQVYGCAALHINWADLAEVKGLAVAPDMQKHGFGAKLVKFCLEEARELGIATVYALTLVPGFFNKLGFSEVPVARLPRKVWGECFRCPKFTHCDEIAVVYEYPEFKPINPLQSSLVPDALRIIPMVNNK